jgi:hypothetical protein
MKQVRYAIGAIGLAPLAIAPAMTPGATQPTVGHAKKVSLEAHTDAACYGDTEVTTYGPWSLERFWYTRDGSVTCVGTVEYFESKSPFSGFDMRVRIWGPNLQYQKYVTGAFVANGVEFNDVVRNYYGGNSHSVEVCVAMVFQSHLSVVAAGPLCAKVPG